MNSQAYFSKYGMPRGRRGCARMVQAGRAVVFLFLHGCQPALAVMRCPWRAHRNRSAMCMPSTPSAGIITASKTPMTTHNISR